MSLILFDLLLFYHSMPVAKTTCSLITLLSLLGFIVYLNALSGKFIWDDQSLVEDNQYIRDDSRLLKIFTQDIGAGSGTKFNFYRPLQVVTYRLDYRLWGLNPLGYHLTNIILHVLVAAVVYWLLTVLFSDHLLGFTAAVLFLVHPIHASVVSYVSGRADSLSALFTLLCFTAYVKSYPRIQRGTYVFMGVSYILALFAKENSLILPALLWVYHATFKKPAGLKKLLGVMGITFIYIGLRVTFLKPILFPLPFSVISFFQRLPGFLVALTNYLRLLFWPFDLHMEYGNYLFFPYDPKVIEGLLIFLSLGLLAIRKRKNHPVISFSILWFLITLLPVSIFAINAYMAESWLYLSSIGFFLLMAYAIHYLYFRRGLRLLAGMLFIGLTTFYSALTIKQNTYWLEPISFYQRTLEYAPESSRIYFNLALEYKKVGQRIRAIAALQKVIEIAPKDFEAYYILEKLYGEIGEKERVEELYTKALEKNPKFWGACINLGNYYAQRGKIGEAIALYQRALEINPQASEVYHNLCVVCTDQKMYELARPYCEKAETLRLDNP